MALTNTDRPLFSRRSFVAGSAAALSLLLVSGCGKRSVLPASHGDSDESKTLKLGISAPSCVDPYNATLSSDIEVASLLFEPLTTCDPVGGAAGPLAASSYSANASADEFTFTIAEGKFSNGETVDSSAFKRAWERLVDPKSSVVSTHGSSAAAYLLSLVEGYAELSSGKTTGLSGVSCPDSRTLKVKLTQPFAEFPVLVSHVALSPVPQAAIDDPVSYFSKPVGNGPYAFASTWKDVPSFKIKQNMRYVGDKPQVKAAKFKIQENSGSAYKLFQAGELDLCEVPIEQAKSAATSRGLSEDGSTLDEGHRLSKVPELSTLSLVFNTRKDVLADVNVRRAISLLLDRDGYVKTLLRDTYIAADGLIPSTCSGYREKTWEYCSLDVNRAKALLDKDYPDRDGSRGLTFTLLCAKEGIASKVAESIVDALKDVGMDITLEAHPSKELASEAAKGAFDLLLTSWDVPVPSMDMWLYPLFYSGDENCFNYSGYSDAETDAKLIAARKSTDVETSVAAYQKVEDMVADQVPMAPIAHPARFVAVSDRFERVSVAGQGQIDLAKAQVKTDR